MCKPGLPLYRALCSAYIGRSMAPYIAVGSMTDRDKLSAQGKAVAGSEGRLVQEVCAGPGWIYSCPDERPGSRSAHQHVS